MEYLFKYISKGPDHAFTEVAEEGQTVDECQHYEANRILGAAEAHWRMYSLDLHGRSPAVLATFAHSPDKDTLIFNPDETKQALAKTSQPTRYFNRREREAFDELTLTDYYEQFIETLSRKEDSVPHPDGLHHLHQGKRGTCVVRLNWVAHAGSELLFLRMILSRYPRRGFEDARMVDGELLEIFEDAARALNLCTDDREFLDAIKEAGIFLTGAALGHLFLSMIVGDHNVPANRIWRMYETLLTDDSLHCVQTEDEASTSALIHLSHLLGRHGRSLSDIGLKEPEDPTTEVQGELLH